MRWIIRRRAMLTWRHARFSSFWNVIMFIWLLAQGCSQYCCEGVRHQSEDSCGGDIKHYRRRISCRRREGTPALKSSLSSKPWQWFELVPNQSQGLQASSKRVTQGHFLLSHTNRPPPPRRAGTIIPTETAPQKLLCNFSASWPEFPRSHTTSYPPAVALIPGVGELTAGWDHLPKPLLVGWVVFIPIDL